MPISQDAGASVLFSVLEDLPVGVWVARAPGGELVYSNRVFKEILGTDARDDVRAGGYAPAYSLQDREGRPYPEERLPFVQALQRRQTVVVDDIVVARADGHRVSVRAFGKPLFDNAGAVSQIVVAFIDITAEVQASAAGAVAQHKLKTALQHAPVILFANDLEGRVTVSEGAALKRMGFEPGQLVGQSIFDLYRDNPIVIENQRRALAGETFTAIADLGEVVLETWMSPMRGPDGAIGGVIGVSTDITERTRMQQQVQQAERLAALGRLAASVAHEINNPLAYAAEAVRLAGEIAARSTGDERARLEDLLREARDGMDRVAHIVRDLKLFSRDDGDVRRPHALNDALASATKLVANRVGARARIDLVAGPDVFVQADDRRLVQIFVNLVLNAADAFRTEARASNVVSIRGRLEEKTAVVEVADNGPGIPAALRERVFEPFFTTKPVGEGTGLGLFVTRSLVEGLGGTIALGDAPGGGALFTIRLPTVEPGPEARAAAAPPRAASATARAQVLIIDDEPQLANMFRAALASRHDVQVFTGGRAALAHLLESEPYDIILCDLMMAELSGMQVFEEVRRLRPGRERAFVFMTGGVFDPKVAEFLASVPNDCLDKPFDVRAEVARRVPVR